jgi:hypothetical protein
MATHGPRVADVGLAAGYCEASRLRSRASKRACHGTSRDRTTTRCFAHSGGWPSLFAAG